MTYEAEFNDLVNRLGELNSVSVLIASHKFREMAVAINPEGSESVTAATFFESIYYQEDAIRATKLGNRFGSDHKDKTAALIESYYGLKASLDRKYMDKNALGLEFDKFMLEFKANLQAHIESLGAGSYTASLVSETLILVEQGQGGFNMPAVEIFLHDSREDLSAFFAVAIAFISAQVSATA